MTTQGPVSDPGFESELLAELTGLATEIEAIAARTTYRFDASRAYYGIVRQRLDQLRPDLVILDVMMPELDGFETLRIIRETSTVPVIMLTVRDDESDKVKGLELGVEDYLTKPINFDLLIEWVDKLT